MSMKNWDITGSHYHEYDTGADTNVTYNGKSSEYVKSIVKQTGGFGALVKKVRADDYHNKGTRFTAMVKTADVEGWAGLWLRVDGTGESNMLALVNMQKRPIKGTTDWQSCDIALDVPAEGAVIFYGLILHGSGQAWISDVRLEAHSTDVPITDLLTEGT
jgi:hypothetical protein